MYFDHVTRVLCDLVPGAGLGAPRLDVPARASFEPSSSDSYSLLGVRSASPAWTLFAETSRSTRCLSGQLILLFEVSGANRSTWRVRSSERLIAPWKSPESPESLLLANRSTRSPISGESIRWRD